MTNPSENQANEALLQNWGSQFKEKKTVLTPHVFYYTLGLLHSNMGKKIDDHTIVKDSYKIFVMVMSRGGIKEFEKDGTLLKEVCYNLSKDNVQIEPQRLLEVYYENLLDKYELVHHNAGQTKKSSPLDPHSVPNAGYNTTTATSTSPKALDSKTSSSPPQWFNDLQSPFYNYQGRFSSIKDVRSGATEPKQNLVSDRKPLQSTSAEQSIGNDGAAKRQANEQK